MKATVTPEALPDAVRVTAESNPPVTVLVMVDDPLLPAATEREVGEAERLNDGDLGCRAGKSSDEADVGAAPSGYEIVSGDGGVAAGGSAGDVVEVSAIAGAYVLLVEGGVEEADGWSPLAPNC